MKKFKDITVGDKEMLTHTITKSDIESNISGQIDQTKIYTEITEPLPYCVHGTTRKAINEIK